ncbi:glycosyltransferase family 2 protein [Ferrimicrobium sp.]|uniref:glycosyltransferase family 2 protein n=1 Tax=Ferrimicrobium sp. TaxID=2926050 RepID=UPI00260C0984|nr:glycosyltransferase family 2 protein [Ferrimicrobium sp.]
MTRVRVTKAYTEWVDRFDTLTTQERPTTRDYARALHNDPDDEMDRLAHDYQWWIQQCDTLQQAESELIREYVASMEHTPTFSYLMVIEDGTDSRRLRRSIGTVLTQLYPHWQLVMIDNQVSDLELLRTIDDYRTRDPRITQLKLNHHHAYADALNSVVDSVKGDFLATLRPGDLLRPHTLAWFGAEVAAHRDAAIVYSDHDSVDDQERRHNHNFKPDWNPDLCLAQNYIGPAVALRTALVRRAGGFAHHLTLYPEWELVLRLSENIEPTQIRHCPTILYHQYDPPSTATHQGTNQHRSEAYEIVHSTLERRGVSHTLHCAPNQTDLIPQYTIIGSPKVSIIIPTHNGLTDLRACIESLGMTTYPNYEVVIVNNQSDDPATLAYMDEVTHLPRHRVIDYPYAFNYSDLHNTVANQLTTDYLCLLNNDTEVQRSDWLEVMLGYAQQPGIGAVGAKLLYSDGTIQHAGVITGVRGLAGHAFRYLPADQDGYQGRTNVPHVLSVVTAACLTIRAELWHEVGGMAEELPIAFNDVDLCLRLRERGYRNIYQPQAQLIHHESKSRGKDTKLSQQHRAIREHGYMQWRWSPQLYSDPMYNPNLTLDSEDFVLAIPRIQRPWAPGIQWVDIPDGQNLDHSHRLPLHADQTITASCLIPATLNGTIEALQIYIGDSVGELDGELEVAGETKDATFRVTESLTGHRREFPFTLHLGDQAFPAPPGEPLTITITPRNNHYPVHLLAFQTVSPWAHHLHGLPTLALKLTMGYRD